MERAIEESASQMIVTTTNTVHIPFSRMTLESQEAVLLRVDPARWEGQDDPPLTAREWNRQMKRVQREMQQRLEEIDRLRKPCGCRQCRRKGRPPFPAYYVVNEISYECWLERQQVDPEMEEILTPLRNTRDRVGSIFVRKMKKTRME
jgi:hypothetical protein